MSSFNYMEDVPVKISENYKPFPNLYKIPQAIVNKTALPSDYYETQPQFNYNFQLENILLTKLPEWRHLRQAERDARSERKKRRELNRKKLEDEQQKQRLVAVSYPSAEDLSSCSSEEDLAKKPTDQKHDENVKHYSKHTAVIQVPENNFHNILQPTIALPAIKSAPIEQEANNVKSIVKTGNTLLSNSFNYKDFEESSTLFDDIELKTINDLDILAQVLQHSIYLKEETGYKKGLQTKEETSETNIRLPSEPSTNLMNKEQDMHSSIMLPTINSLENVNYKKLLYKANDNQISPQQSGSSCLPENFTRHDSTIAYQKQNSLPNSTSPRKSILDSLLSCEETWEGREIQMIQKLGSIGFCEDLVKRISILYNTDHRKIIKHLLNVDELMDLGFSENRISAALLKCDNNKEKALEILISE